MRLWTARVGDEWGHKCAVCGSENLPNAHHLENRNTCRALRYDPMNGVLLCPSHHKFGKDSAHKGGIWFADWLRRHHPGRLNYVLAHRLDEINLNDRATLATIEEYLKEPRPMIAPLCPDITLHVALELAADQGKHPAPAIVFPPTHVVPPQPVPEPEPRQTVQPETQNKEETPNESNPADIG